MSTTDDMETFHQNQTYQYHNRCPQDSSIESKRVSRVEVIDSLKAIQDTLKARLDIINTGLHITKDTVNDCYSSCYVSGSQVSTCCGCYGRKIGLKCIDVVVYVTK